MPNIRDIYPNIPPMDTRFYTDSSYRATPFRRNTAQVILGSMSQCPAFLAFDVPTQTRYVMLVEKGCVNATITKSIEENISRDWQADRFRRMYSSLVAELVEALDWSNYQYLMNKLLTGQIEAFKLGELSVVDMVPVTDMQLRVDKRYKTEIRAKTTSMYTCPNCHKKEAIPQEAQLRSGDEGKDTLLICVYCGTEWIERC